MRARHGYAMGLAQVGVEALGRSDYPDGTPGAVRVGDLLEEGHVVPLFLTFGPGGIA